MVAIVCTLKKNASSNDPDLAFEIDPGWLTYPQAKTALAKMNAPATSRKNCHHELVRTVW
jgi:hypothetical protein